MAMTLRGQIIISGLGRDADGGQREAWKGGCKIMHTHYFTAPFLGPF
jgi:hypothetical protein